MTDREVLIAENIAADEREANFSRISAQIIRLLLIGIWIGSAIFFAFAVAPSAFAALPSAELAGQVVQKTLAVLNLSGVAIALILLLTSFMWDKRVHRFPRWIEKIGLLIFGAMCALGHFVIASQMHAIRDRLAQDAVPAAEIDALKQSFGTLHVYSTWVLLAALGAAVFVFITINRRTR